MHLTDLPGGMRAGQPKKKHLLPGSDPRMSDPDHQAAFEALFLDWIQS